MLGLRALSMGLGAVGLVMPKPWVIGTLARQLWAVPARTSSQSDLPFINYNMQVSFGFCVTSITGPNGGAELYER